MTNKCKFILASASPRRHELLCSIGIPHEVFVTDADETPSSSPVDGEMYGAWFAREVSLKKCIAALEAFEYSETDKRIFVISADTVVSPDGVEIYGKPKNYDDAFAMLSTLSGREHYVLGGITVAEILSEGPKYISRSVVTKVRFKSLTPAEINAYIASGEPDGKAGAYAIQGLGGVFVSSIEGDYPNVVGISTHTLCEILEHEFSLKITEADRQIIAK